MGFYVLTQQNITGTQQPITGTVSHLVILLECPQRIPHHSSSYGLILQKFSHCTSQKYSSYPSLLQITSVVWFPDPSTVRKGLGKWPTFGIAKHWIPPWAWEVLQLWLSQNVRAVKLLLPFHSISFNSIHFIPFRTPVYAKVGGERYLSPSTYLEISTFMVMWFYSFSREDFKMRQIKVGIIT